MLVRKVKRKTRNFEASLCGSLYSTFKTSFYHAFYNKRLRGLFTDQFVRSKSTCSFKAVWTHLVSTLFVQMALKAVKTHLNEQVMIFAEFILNDCQAIKKLRSHEYKYILVVKNKHFEYPSQVLCRKIQNYKLCYVITHVTSYYVGAPICI